MKAGRASSTAKVIAASTLLLASDAVTAALVPAKAAKLCHVFLSDSMADQCLRWAAVQPWLRPLWHLLEACTHRGIMRHYWHRKRWIEARCRAALTQGVQRVIVIGAGFDTLALRLAPEHPDVQWFELDHPDTQAAKQRGMAVHHVPLPNNLRMLACDLTREGLPPQLVRDQLATLVILEGLLMYLPQPVVQSWLATQLPSLSTKRVRIIFSYMVLWPQGRPGFRPASRMIDAWLRWRGEPFAWWQAPEVLQTDLSAQGFECLAHQRPPFGEGDSALRGAAATSGLQGENLLEAVAPPG